MGLSAKDGAALMARMGAPAPVVQGTEQGGDLTAEGAATLEHGEQARLATALDAAGMLWNHCPNEGKRPGRTGRTLRGQGLKPGWPDVLIVTPAADGRPTVLELKRVGLRPKRAAPGLPPWAPGCFTAEQRRYLERFEAAGWHALVAYGADDAIEQLRGLGYPLEVGR